MAHNIIENKKWLKPQKLFYFWGFFILILCCLPGVAFPKTPIIPGLDKVIHAYLYGQWTWFFLKGYLHQKNSFLKYIGIVAISAVYGSLIEIIQHFFISHRSFELADIFADIFGAALVCFVWIILKKREKDFS